MWLPQLCACVHQPSQDGNCIRRNRSTFGRCTWRTWGALTPTRIPIKKMKRSPQLQRQLTFSRGSRTDYPFGLVAPGLWPNRTEKRWQSLAVLTTPSLHPLLQQKPIALCFECLVATSLYLIPWVYNCSPSPTYPELPLAIIFSPNCLLHIHASPIPLTNAASCQWSFYSFFYLIIFFLCRATHPVLADTAPNPHSGARLRLDPGNGLFWTLWCAEDSME